MTPYERAAKEALRRVEVLPSELDGWIIASQANVDGLGIHRSQLLALRVLMETLTARQRAMLAARPQPDATTAFAESEIDFTAEVVGAYELWTAFRSVFEQRRDARLVRALDAADLVAASAYRSAMGKALEWEAVKPNEFREPPLVCAEAVGSPATAARGRDAAGLTATIRRYRGKALPIPMVLYPADRLDDIWSFATLAHEVGHDLEADLAFSSEAVDLGVAAIAVAGASPARQEAWRSWGDEVVADAVGVVLGGAGFVTNLFDWLSTVALAKLFATANGDPHPPPHVRVRVLIGLLSASGVAIWNSIAAELAATANASNPPAWQVPFADDTEAFATAVLTSPLTAFSGHSILELSPNIANDAAVTEKLATYLLSTFKRPSPKGPPPFETRLVPSAAALAVHRSSANGDLAGIARRALDYVHEIPRPAFLAGPVAGRDAYLQGLAQALDVR
jgi:hypothetical protein